MPENKRALDTLLGEYETVVKINRALNNDITNYRTAIYKHNTQINSMLKIYNKFSGKSISRDELKNMN